MTCSSPYAFEIQQGATYLSLSCTQSLHHFRPLEAYRSISFDLNHQVDR